MENYILLILLAIIFLVLGYLIGSFRKEKNSINGLDELFKKIDEESSKWDVRYEPVKEISDALKGGTRRGKLGEVALEILMEQAELPKGIVYNRNKRFTDDQNKIKEPDFIIEIPGDRQIVIDCKFPFDDWERYNKAIEDGETKKQIESYHKEYIRTVKKMIDETNERQYSKLKEINTIDSTIVYFPMVNTFETFEDYFIEVIQYAQKRNVLLANPTIILYVVNIIRTLWSQERRDKNLDLVKDYVEKIYDQIEGLDSSLKKSIKDFENITDQTKGLRNKLRGGRNSIVELAKKIISLIGGTPKKKMDDWINVINSIS